MSSFRLGGGGTSWSHCFPVPSAFSHSLTSSPFSKRNCGHCDTKDLTTPLCGRISSGSGGKSEDCFLSTTHRKSGSSCCSAVIVTRSQSSGRVVLVAGDAAVPMGSTGQGGRVGMASPRTVLYLKVKLFHHGQPSRFLSNGCRSTTEPLKSGMVRP